MDCDADNHVSTELLTFGTGALMRPTGSSAAVPDVVERLRGKLVVDVAISGATAAVLTLGGELYMSGANESGQADPDNDGGSIEAPRRVGALAARRVICVSAGESHTAVVTSSAAALTWGSDEYGASGHAKSTEPAVVRGLPRLGRVAQVACGSTHTLILMRTGELFAAGSNVRGALGRAADSGESTARVGGALLFEAVACCAAGDNFSVAITAGGHSFAWGSNRYGQLGIRRTEVPVAAFTAQRVQLPELAQTVAAGGSHTAWITRSGRAYTTGRGDKGQLAIGLPTRDHAVADESEVQRMSVDVPTLVEGVA